MAAARALKSWREEGDQSPKNKGLAVMKAIFSLWNKKGTTKKWKDRNQNKIDKNYKISLLS